MNNTIYLLSVTHDDGETFHTLSCIGYFLHKAEVEAEVQRRNKLETGELSRWEYRPCRRVVQG